MDKELMQNLGEKIADKVSEQIMIWAQTRSLGVETGSVGASGDYTKEGDAYAEKTAVDVISNFLEDNGYKAVLIAEESGVITLGEKESDKGCFIILDPLDGSNNLRPWRTPSPLVSTSIAIGDLSNLDIFKNFDAVDGGFVKDIFNKRLFYSKKDMGAHLRSWGKINSSPEKDLEKAVIGVDLDLSGKRYGQIYPDLADLMAKKKCQRRIGSSILDFMKVACGEYDSFVTIGGRMGLYDLAAAKLIVEEAGGVFEIISDQPDYCVINEIIQTGDNSLLETTKYKVIASGNQNIHKSIMDIVRK